MMDDDTLLKVLGNIAEILRGHTSALGQVSDVLDRHNQMDTLQGHINEVVSRRLDKIETRLDALLGEES